MAAGIAEKLAKKQKIRLLRNMLILQGVNSRGTNNTGRYKRKG